MRHHVADISLLIRARTIQLSMGEVVLPVINFLEPLAADIDLYSSYACSDAGRFESCINIDQKISVMNRLIRAQDRKANGVGMIGGFQVGTNWNADALKNCYERVRKERYGECTTFAKAAGHLLAQAKAPRPRLEIIAYENHVLLVVGRNGGYSDVGKGFRKKRQLPQLYYSDANSYDGAAWGADWAIVDPWAGAMGYEDTIYQMSGGRLRGVNFQNEYPCPGMLHPVSLIMERPAD